MTPTEKLQSLLTHIVRHSHNGATYEHACAHCSGVEILAREALEALASHAPSEPRCSNCKRLPSEYEPGMCSECDWRKDHSSEPELPQIVLDSPICDICGHHTLDSRFHHAPGSQGNMWASKASEAAAQPTLEMPMNRQCNKCAWVHAVGSPCPNPDAMFRTEIQHDH